jgi:hypothetical protein
VRKLVSHGHTAHVAAGMAGAVLGIAGNQLVARYKMAVGWVDPDLTTREADVLGAQVAAAVSGQLPRAGSLTWVARAAPD